MYIHFDNNLLYNRMTKKKASAHEHLKVDGGSLFVFTVTSFMPRKTNARGIAILTPNMMPI